MSAFSSSNIENTISGQMAVSSVDMTYSLLKGIVRAGWPIVYSIGLFERIDSSIVRVAVMQGSTKVSENDVFISVYMLSGVSTVKVTV